MLTMAPFTGLAFEVDPTKGTDTIEPGCASETLWASDPVNDNTIHSMVVCAYVVAEIEKKDTKKSIRITIIPLDITIIFYRTLRLPTEEKLLLP